MIGRILGSRSKFVEKFNTFFVNIESHLPSSIPNVSTKFSSYLKAHNPSSFFLYSTDADEIVKIVTKFQNKQSFGVDGIPISIVKASVEYIAEPLSRII